MIKIDIRETYFSSGQLKSQETYNEKGELICQKTYYDTGLPESEAWYQNGKLHRINDAAKVLYYNYEDDDKPVKESIHYCQNGEYHRTDGPAYVEYSHNNDDGYHLYITKYYQHGTLHNENGPAVKINRDYEFESRYYINGILHREDGPAITINRRFGPNYREHRVNGKLHRETGPAKYEETSPGNILWGEYYKDNKFLYKENEHPIRDNNPYKYLISLLEENDATYYSNGQIRKKEYRTKGNLHNDNGPAFISYYFDGTNEVEAYFSNGNLCEIKEWWRNGNLRSESRYQNEKLIYSKTYHENGKPKKEAHFLDDKLHNSNGPAFKSWDSGGDIRKEEYYVKGISHNENGPAKRYYRSHSSNNKTVALSTEEYWHHGIKTGQKDYNIKGNLYNEYFYLKDKSSGHKTYHENGNLDTLSYYDKNNNLTLYQEYYLTGHLKIEKVYSNNKITNYKTYYENGTPKSISHYNRHGELHHSSEPAHTIYDPQGNKTEKYYIDGILCTNDIVKQIQRNNILKNLAHTSLITKPKSV